MRPIKFRVWSSKYSAMDFPISIGIDDSGHIDHVTGYGAEYNDGEFELMQFAGLCDKNGREIYEGDIVYAYNEDFENSIHGTTYRDVEVTDVIVFKNGSFVLGEESQINLTYLPFIEVIGNIWEDGDLLDCKNTETN